MIPGIAVFSSRAQQQQQKQPLPRPPPKKTTGGGDDELCRGVGDIEAMRRRNEELERELSESRQREEATRRELERTKGRLRLVEEAEERLCSQLGDLEAEAASQSLAYHLQIRALTEQLARAQALHMRPSSVRSTADCAASATAIVGGRA